MYNSVYCLYGDCILGNTDLFINNNMENKFQKAYQIDVNTKTEKKGNLTYLSWAWAWAEFKKIYEDATYSVKKFGEDNLPYVYDEKTGYMVFTEVTADNTTLEMWLPVMDFRNQALKSNEASMFDINKTIMRCLTKNLAMFGLGLYIYAGEDLPEVSNEIFNDVDNIKTLDELKEYYNKNKGLGKEFDAYVSKRKLELSK